MQFYPDTYKEFKLSYDKELAEAGNIVLNYLIENNLLTHPDSIYNAIHFAVLYYKKSHNTLCIWDPVTRDITDTCIDSQEIIDILSEKIIKRINPIDSPSRIKFEIIEPVPKYNNLRNSNTRYPYLRKQIGGGEIEYDLNHSSTVWHVDNVDYSNMVSVTFLDDVSENGGGTIVSSEQLVAVYNVDGSLNEEKTFGDIKKLSDIKGYKVVGPAGTVVAFNSHLFHSGDVPADKSRKVMLVDFHCSNPNLRHPGVPTI